MNKHFLQSETWQKYEELEGKKTFSLQNDDFSIMATLGKTPMGNYLYAPYGPALKDKKSFKKAMEAFKDLAKENQAIFIRVEPTLIFSEAEMRKAGFEKSKDLDPQHTWILDITVPEEQILENIESRKTRYWRNYAKKGITIRTSKRPEEISILSKLLANLGEKDNFTPQNEEHLKNQLKSGFATLYIAELEGKPIAASLIYDFEDTRYYAHAAADFEYRKLAAGTVLLIQMILDAKSEGKKCFDFWGITTSEDHNHPWYGFTQYKKSFGGEEVDYTGTYDLPIDKAKYKLYKMMRPINRIKRKLIK